MPPATHLEAAHAPCFRTPVPSATPGGKSSPARARGCDVAHVGLADDRPRQHRRRSFSVSPPRGTPPDIAGYPSWWCCRCTLSSPSPRPARRCVFWRSFSGMTSTYCPCRTRSSPLGIRCGAGAGIRHRTRTHVTVTPYYPPAGHDEGCSDCCCSWSSCGSRNPILRSVLEPRALFPAQPTPCESRRSMWPRHRPRAPPSSGAADEFAGRADAAAGVCACYGGPDPGGAQPRFCGAGEGGDLLLGARRTGACQTFSRHASTLPVMCATVQRTLETSRVRR